MKLTLTTEAQSALKEITVRILEANPYADKSATAITAKIVADFSENADCAAIERVANRLVSAKRKQRTLLKKLAELAEREGDAALQVLEKSVRKLDRSNTESNEIVPEK